MAARQSMDHDGFYSDRGPMGALAENVAWGCATESCAMRMWENSSGHRANMLLSDVKNYAWRRPRADERGIGALIAMPRMSTICSLQCTQRKRQDSTSVTST
jgi:hypothetical protein